MTHGIGIATHQEKGAVHAEINRDTSAYSCRDGVDVVFDFGIFSNRWRASGNDYGSLYLSTIWRWRRRNHGIALASRL